MGGGQYLSKIKTLNTPAKRSILSSTPISLNSIDEKVRSLTGETRTTPITMKGLDDKINEIMKKSQVTTGKFVSNIISHGESILLDISHTITDNTMITGAIYVIRDGYNGNIVVPIDNQKVKTLNLSGSSGSDKYATVIGIGYDTPSNKIKLKNLSQLVGTTISIIYAVYEA